ncbi:hypothetical protein EZV62_019093 [Acer yangbiense]|uniref:Peroxidase n=1 Tax=Acer yangbiense TaxID=1000413 RepID=A0A5C7HAA9_9ROSI|nr:hypothetical protein EZV62_019093 [Acer yangbiense]
MGNTTEVAARLQSRRIGEICANGAAKFLDFRDLQACQRQISVEEGRHRFSGLGWLEIIGERAEVLSTAEVPQLLTQFILSPVYLPSSLTHSPSIFLFFFMEVTNNRHSMPLCLLLLFFMVGFSQAQLKIGFYSEKCPEVESIVRGFVQDAVLSNPNMAAVLLRLHFHDCFVEGCDGSILIENGPNSEKHAFGHQGVGGFEVIERAKARLEDECGGVVSCADIVAMAARDAIALSNGPAYDVPTGRRDGEVSNVSLADDMPDVSDSIQQLKTKFFLKGLSDKDLVLLSGISLSLSIMHEW